MNKKLLPAFIVAGLCGLGAVVGAQRYIQGEIGRGRAQLQQKWEEMTKDYQNPVNVIVARQDLPEGHAITADDLALRPIPPKFFPPSATERGEDVVGMETIVPFSSGEPVLKDKVRPPGKKAEAPKTPETLSELTPTGKRAVSIELDDIAGVGGFIKPGDSVDVLWTFSNPSPSGGAEPVTMTIFQGVQVLAVGDQIIGTSPVEGSETTIHGHTLTLALTPQETALLLYARRNGELQLSLRSKGDEGQKTVVDPANRTAILKAVLGESAVSQPIKTSAERQVDVFKGLERNAVSISSAQ